MIEKTIKKELVAGLTIKDTHTFMIRVDLIKRYNMSKYVDRILEEVELNFDRHFHDNEGKVDFLEELIEELKDRLEDVNDDDDCECYICPEGECDCEPEVCI
jgi:hypothetical protein